jgi:hypothetical protein
MQRFSVQLALFWRMVRLVKRSKSMFTYHVGRIMVRHGVEMVTLMVGTFTSRKRAVAYANTGVAGKRFVIVRQLVAE